MVLVFESNVVWGGALGISQSLEYVLDEWEEVGKKMLFLTKLALLGVLSGLVFVFWTLKNFRICHSVETVFVWSQKIICLIYLPTCGTVL